jgi:formylglycine-generating enzyme required for sulfatase activity
VAWLSRKTGKSYRLPSEAKWEYAARAGTRTRFWWGDGVGRNNANCDGCGSAWDKRLTAPVGSFAANGFGLHDMHGNVAEWVEDCWGANYRGAPADGTAWTSGECSSRMLRGGSYYDGVAQLRSAHRSGGTTDVQTFKIGFRVARSP